MYSQIHFTRKRYRKSRKDHGNREMKILRLPRRQLPSNVDMRHWMTPVEFQGDMNTCCANAFATVCEYLISRLLKVHIDLSRLFIYYNGQVLSQRTLRVADEGVNQKHIALALRKYGVCFEETWPYEQHLLNREPSQEAYREANRYTCMPLRLLPDLESVRTCLSNHIPVPLDIQLGDRAGKFIEENHGYLGVPNSSNRLLDGAFLHTVVLVGYNDKYEQFIARNSWGTDWGGYGGYFYLPYQYLTNHRLSHSHDGLWTIMKIFYRKYKLPDVRQLAVS